MMNLLKHLKTIPSVIFETFEDDGVCFYNGKEYKSRNEAEEMKKKDIEKTSGLTIDINQWKKRANTIETKFNEFYKEYTQLRQKLKNGIPVQKLYSAIRNSIDKMNDKCLEYLEHLKLIMALYPDIYDKVQSHVKNKRWCA